MPFLGVNVGVFRPSLEEPSPIKSNDESSSVSSTKQEKNCCIFNNFNDNHRFIPEVGLLLFLCFIIFSSCSLLFVSLSRCCKSGT